MKTKGKLRLLVAFFVILATLVAIGIFKRPLYRMTSDFQHPFTVPLSDMANTTAKKSLMMKNKSDLAKEILALRKINERQAAEIAVSRDMEKELRELESLMELPPSQGFKPVFAKIVVRDPISWDARFSINKGKLDGISVGDVALAQAVNNANAEIPTFALVGRVLEVSGHRALIETIASMDCRISVVVENNLAAGITEGASIKNGEPLVRLSKLPASKKYLPGYPVVTSGLGIKDDGTSSNIPPGLLVGVLAATSSGKTVEVVDKLTAEAKIIPAVNLDSLREVAIMVRAGAPQ